MTYGWHFLYEGHKLRDGSKAPDDGVWLTVPRAEICKAGLHGSRTPFQALQHAPGPILCLCEFGAIVAEHKNDKFVSRERRIIARMDATEPLQYFARMQALSVVHQWDAPNIVLDFLMTGDEAIRDSARAAAWTVAWDSARAAAWAAARAAAWDSARAAARDSAWAAARDSAWAAARDDFNNLIYECFEGPLAAIAAQEGK